MARPAAREPKPSHAQVRSARKAMSERVLDTWSFVGDVHANVPRGTEKPPASDADRGASDAFTIDDARVLDWREPYYASSDPSSDNLSADNDDLFTVHASKRAGEIPKHLANPSPMSSRWKRRSLRLLGVTSPADPGYDHDGESETGTIATSHAEDSDSPTLLGDSKKCRRKIRRRRRFEAEMAWNDGLRFWEARREAWCCARTTRLSESPHLDVQEEEEEDDDDSDASTEDDTVSGAEERNSTRSARQSTSRSSPTKRARASLSSTSLTTESIPEGSPLKSLHRRSLNAHDDPRASTKYSTPIFPVAAPILPTSDPTRASMSPALYPSIYSKVVLQGLTPSVPVNLSHIIPAMVNGWKADGEWPSAPDPSTGAAVDTAPASKQPEKEKKKKAPPAPKPNRDSKVPRPRSWLHISGRSTPTPTAKSDSPPDEAAAAAKVPSATAPPPRAATTDPPASAVAPAATRRAKRRPLSWAAPTSFIHSDSEKDEPGATSPTITITSAATTPASRSKEKRRSMSRAKNKPLPTAPDFGGTSAAHRSSALPHTPLPAHAEARNEDENELGDEPAPPAPMPAPRRSSWRPASLFRADNAPPSRASAVTGDDAPTLSPPAYRRASRRLSSFSLHHHAGDGDGDGDGDVAPSTTTAPQRRASKRLSGFFFSLRGASAGGDGDIDEETARPARDGDGERPAEHAGWPVPADAKPARQPQGQARRRSWAKRLSGGDWSAFTPFAASGAAARAGGR